MITSLIITNALIKLYLPQRGALSPKWIYLPVIFWWIWLTWKVCTGEAVSNWCTVWAVVYLITQFFEIGLIQVNLLEEESVVALLLLLLYIFILQGIFNKLQAKRTKSNKQNWNIMLLCLFIQRKWPQYYICVSAPQGLQFHFKSICSKMFPISGMRLGSSAVPRFVFFLSSCFLKKWTFVSVWF